MWETKALQRGLEAEPPWAGWREPEVFWGRHSNTNYFSLLDLEFFILPTKPGDIFLSHLLSIEIGKVTLPRKKVSLETANCKAMLTAFPGDRNSEDE